MRGALGSRFRLPAVSFLTIFIIAGCSQRPEVAGIYLADGGGEYYTIEESFLRGLSVTGSSDGVKWNAFRKGDKLYMTFTLGLAPAHDTPVQISTRLEFVASARSPGDWDLIGFFYEPADLPPSPLIEPPVLSFLHRVDDRRIETFFEKVEVFNQNPADKDLFEQIRELATDMQTDYPEDLYVRNLYLHALLLKPGLSIDSDCFHSLKRSIVEWTSDYHTSDQQVVQGLFRQAERALYGVELSASGRNVYDFAVVQFARDVDLASRLDSFPGILEYEEFVWPLSRYAETVMPSYSEMLTGVKVFLTESYFMILQGRTEQAGQLIAASYRLSQLLSCSGGEMNRLIGASFRGLAAQGLLVLVLDASNTADDMEQLWPILQLLDECEQAISLEEASFIQPAVRDNVASARFQCIRMAAAARHRLLSEGEFPQSADEFAPLLPEGPPKDPFGSKRMKFFSREDSFTCYSVGPDEQDDRAEVVYDPTNGMLSGGDIVLEGPRQRRYPFPADGVRATSIVNFRRQFPNGLPLDPFGPARAPDIERSLQISNTTPVYVYSRGPDLDIDSGDLLERFVPKNHYDPTNGMISSGDLFVEIPQ